MRPTLRDLLPREYWRRFATEKRILTAVHFSIECPALKGFVIRPFEPDWQESDARLVDNRENWLTTKKGSSVLVRIHGVWNMHQIREVRLHDVSPEKYVGTEVESVIEWLEGVPALHESELSGYAEGIPCDLRGFIPTEETGPFDLDWPYLRPTHRYNGTKTAYGEQWEAYWPSLKAQAIEKTRIALELMAADKANVDHSSRLELIVTN